MEKDLNHRHIAPNKSIVDFVDSFWSLQNKSATFEGVIIPNGRIDLLFSKTETAEFKVTLLGLDTVPKPPIFKEQFLIFAISFKPLAIEYVFHHSIADILDNKKVLSDKFWNISIDDLNDFAMFCKKVEQKIQSLLPNKIDERKRKLFELVFATNGEMSVKELSKKVFWSTRQINAYFRQQFGLTLKEYCRIIRFEASLGHVKEGRLSPELNYYDQSHFIKEVKNLSGISPKDLFKNPNSRFLQFSEPPSK